MRAVIGLLISKTQHRWLPISLIVMLVVAVSSSAYAGDTQDDRYLTIAIGHVAIFDHSVEDPGVIKFEYRWGSFTHWQLHPTVGVGRSDNNASFLFAAVERDFYLNALWVVTPSFGLGIFEDGANVELGNELEFRSGVVVAYQFINRVRLGLSLFHLSNGGISDTNPGTEPAFVSLAVPF